MAAQWRVPCEGLSELTNWLYSPIGIRPPLSPAHSPSSNGNPCFPGRMDVIQAGQPISSKLQKHLGETWGSGSRRVYAAAGGLIAFLLLMLFVTVYFLGQTGWISIIHNTGITVIRSFVRGAMQCRWYHTTILSGLIQDDRWLILTLTLLSKACH